MFSRLANGEFLLNTSQRINYPLGEVFAFFSKAENLEILTPPFLNFSVTTETPIVMQEGTLIDYRIRLHGIPIRWRSLITEWSPPHFFSDFQVKGPYRYWHHQHHFEEVPDGTLVHDKIRYRVFGGYLIEKFFVRPDLTKIFEFRRQKLAEIFPE